MSVHAEIETTTSNGAMCSVQMQRCGVDSNNNSVYMWLMSVFSVSEISGVMLGIVQEMTWRQQSEAENFLI